MYHTISSANNKTALHHAAKLGCVAIIKSLLDKDMSVNLINTVDSMPLHIYAEFGQMEVTKNLV
jgi:ankyrin repeat protein